MTSFLFNRYSIALAAVAIFADPVITFAGGVMDGVAQALTVLPA